MPALPTRSPMARARSEIDTFTVPEGRRRRVYRPRGNDGAILRVVNVKCSSAVRRVAPGERSDARGRGEGVKTPCRCCGLLDSRLHSGGQWYASLFPHHCERREAIQLAA